MAVSGVNSDRNYLDALNSDKNSAGKVYNAVFANGDEDNLSISDFFNMMILQLTNQDFMNPVDDTQYLSQMAQFATMQEMMDLCQYSKQNYVTAMLGKEVTISKNMIGGEKRDVVGVVEKIMLQDGDYKVYVDGKPYDLSKVVQIAEKSSAPAGTAKPEEASKPEETVKPDNSDESESELTEEELLKSQLADG